MKNGTGKWAFFSKILSDFFRKSLFSAKTTPVNFECIISFAVLTEGFPVPNSTCDRVFPGRTGPRRGSVSGSTRRILRGRPDLRAELDKAEEEAEEDEGPGAIVCSSTLVPTEAQSVTLVVSE